MVRLEELLGVGEDSFSGAQLAELGINSPEVLTRVASRLNQVSSRAMTLTELIGGTDHYDREFTAAMSRVYPRWVNLEEVARRSDNFFGRVPATDAPWFEFFTQKLVELLLERGDLVNITPQRFDWRRLYSETLRDKQVVFIGEPKEDEWEEFTGTFNDDRLLHGICADVVYSDGTSGILRWQVSLGDFFGELKLT